MSSGCVDTREHNDNRKVQATVQGDRTVEEASNDKESALIISLKVFRDP